MAQSLSDFKQHLNDDLFGLVLGSTASCCKQKLDLMILADPFQDEIFSDSLVSIFNGLDRL